MKKIDYRHYICIFITLGFLLFGLAFPYAFPRFLESVRDLFNSIGYYFCEIFANSGDEYINPINPTVAEISSISIKPFWEISINWEDFKGDFSEFFVLFFKSENFLSYLFHVCNLLLNVSRILILMLPLFLSLWLLFSGMFNAQKTDDNKDSKPLLIFKRISDYTYQPLLRFCKSFVMFVRENPWYYRIWFLLLAFYFNTISILVEFVAFYFYFAISFDLGNILIQIYKLSADLSELVNFVPVFFWGILGFYIINKKADDVAYNRLNHNEKKNRGFINERGVSTIIDGPMGSGKTLLGTDMALSAEVQLRDQAYEIIIESDFKFPNFPWINLERDLRRAFDNHEIFSIPSCRRWLRHKYRAYRRKRCSSRIWDYDLNRYSTRYDDKLKIQNIWEVIDDYSCAYLVYTVQSSLLITNYSIRVDNLFLDIGNFPLWNTDFFKRDSKYIESYSRHSHILDFDMLRLGKKMLERNPNRNAFGFGVYVITEFDKERKNQNELRDKKASDEECNQKNDLMPVLMKMSRHACVIANRVFVMFIADLQRTGDISSGVVELGEVIHISNVGKFCPVLPFWSPFYVIEAISNLFISKFENFYKNARFNRSDNTLTVYILKAIVVALKNYIKRKNNIFGTRVVSLDVERPRGEILSRKYYESSKKILSDRYGTDCHSGIFEARAEYNTVGINDIQEYYGKLATDEELLLQHSFFQVDAHSCIEECENSNIEVSVVNPLIYKNIVGRSRPRR